MISEDGTNFKDTTTYSFGEFNLEAENLLLLRNSEVVPLAPKAVEVLVALVESGGKLITKQEILDKVWADTFVEEANLTHHISALRKALGEDRNGRRFIETIPRRGYRFAAPVSRERTGATEIIISEQCIAHLSEEIEINIGNKDAQLTIPADVAKPFDPRFSIFLPIAAAVLTIIVAAAAAEFYSYYKDSNKTFNQSAFRLIPVTSGGGHELESAISPDGTLIAYAGAEFVSDTRFPDAPQVLSSFNLYVKQANGEKSLKLTDKPGRVITPAWSPDNRFIAYAYKSQLDQPGDSFLYIIPALGGAERKIYEAENLAYVAWSPDGESLAFYAHPMSAAAGAIFLLNLKTGAVRQLTSPVQGADIYPSFSPDGNFISYVHQTNKTSDIFVVPAGGGESVQITDDKRAALGRAVWMPDGKTLIYGSNRTGSSRLWTIAGDGASKSQLLDGAGEPASNPSISADGKRLTYTKMDIDWNIWRVPLVNQEGIGERRERIIASTRLEKCAAVAPDGEQIVFVSNQTGAAREIRLAAANGSNQRQLTFFEKGAIAAHPSWSPDDRHIAFDASTDGTSAIYTLNVENGMPQKLSDEKIDAVAPSWSRDGKSIYFAAQRDDQPWQIWRISAAGGAAEQITISGGYEAHESPDGNYIYYNKAGYGTIGIFRLPTNAKANQPVQEEKVFDLVQVDSIGEWIVTETGIFYLYRLEPNDQLATHPRVRFYDFATRQTSDVLFLPFAPLSDPCLNLSPTKDWLYYSQNDKTEVDVMMLEKFD